MGLSIDPERSDAFIVTEFFSTVTLFDVILLLGASKPQRRLPEVTVWQIAEQIANAVSYLHMQGIVHGNLSSMNVLLLKLQTKYESYTDSTGISQWKVKIHDFSMARYKE